MERDPLSDRCTGKEKRGQKIKRYKKRDWASKRDHTAPIFVPATPVTGLVNENCRR